MTTTLSKMNCRAVSLAAALVLASASAALADPTDGSADGPSGRATVTVPTSSISKVSGKYSTDSFTCNATEKSMLARQIFNASTGTVAVHFVGEFFEGARALISLRRNGVLVPGPGDAASPMAAHDTSGDLSTNGFNWAVANVPAGLQTFSVTCRAISGISLTVDERSLVIYHR